MLRAYKGKGCFAILDLDYTNSLAGICVHIKRNRGMVYLFIGEVIKVLLCSCVYIKLATDHRQNVWKLVLIENYPQYNI